MLNRQIFIQLKKEKPKDESKIDLELQKLMDKYKIEIRVKYKEELSKDLMERSIPNKLSYCRESSRKITAATNVLKDLAEEYKAELEDCSKLNTMIYAAAIVVARAKTKTLSKSSNMKKNSHSASDVNKMDRAVGGQPQNKFREKEIMSMSKKRLQN